MSPRWPLERSRERYWFVANVTWVTVRPGKIHANSTASKWAELQKRETCAHYRNFFFNRMNGKSKGTLVLQDSHGLWTICPFITLLSSLFALFLTNWLELLLRNLIAFPPHPNTPPVLQFNFVGKLLGPRGNSMKRLQEETGAKMSILGKGSMRDKDKVWMTYLCQNSIGSSNTGRNPN